MNRKKLTQTLATKLGRSKTDINALIDAFNDILLQRCSDMDSVAIPGFGTFEPKMKKERLMVNPSNGKRMLIPPKVVLSFKVSNVLKNQLKR